MGRAPGPPYPDPSPHVGRALARAELQLKSSFASSLLRHRGWRSPYPANSETLKIKISETNPAISFKTNILTPWVPRVPKLARPKPAGNVSDRVKCCHRGDLERPSNEKNIDNPAISLKTNILTSQVPRVPKLFDNQTKLPSPPLQPRTAVSGSFKHTPMSPPSHPVDSPKKNRVP